MSLVERAESTFGSKNPFGRAKHTLVESTFYGKKSTFCAMVIQ